MAKLKATLLFLALATAAEADWTIVTTEANPGRAGIVHRHLVLENGARDHHAVVDLAVFSTELCTMQVIDNADGESNLAQAMNLAKSSAGVNGGYFDPKFAPIGLRIVNGKTVAPLVRARLITGVLLASWHGVQIARTAEFSRKQPATAAIQCGPFLVDAGQRIKGLNDSRPARRTFAANATNHQAVLGVCSDVSLAELGEILATPRLVQDSKILRALNLDGGSSSAFWFKREKGSAFSIPEQKSVRDFVAIVPK